MLCYLEADHFKLKIREWNKIYHTNTNHNKVGMSILISDKVDFRTSNITRNKGKYFIINMGSILLEDRTILNTF